MWHIGGRRDTIVSASAADVDDGTTCLDPGQRAAAAALAEPSDYGYYLWGPVGRGKTMLANRYFDSIATRKKLRLHLYDYLHHLHRHLATGEPLTSAVTAVIGDYRAVMLDEFHVHDVADATYLAETLRTLIDRRIPVLTTSNYPPHELLPNPLYHDSFTPAIALIENHLRVIEIADGIDYRQRVPDYSRNGFSAGTWHISPDPRQQPDTPIAVHANGFTVHAMNIESNRADFTFAELCERPLCAREYRELAGRYDALGLHYVPSLASAGAYALQRFCDLIDILYSRDTRLEVTAAGNPDEALSAPCAPPDIARTVSRLHTLIYD